MDYKELVNLGLSEKEAKVYLAALELGKSVVQKIARKAEVNRATTYVIIDVLMKKGLISSYAEGKKQYFCAESPEKLNLLFREQITIIQKREEYLKEILPNLKALEVGDKNKPIVRYFEGKEGLKSIAEEISSYKEDPARMVYSEDLLRTIFSDQERKTMKTKRIKKKVKTKILYNYKNNILKNTQDGTRIKIFEKDYPITCDIAIFGKDKIRMTTLKNKIMGLIIENKEIHTTLKSIFDLAWIGAKFINKENDRKQ